ncbi:MAG: sugar O-acetyltransferase [Lachnospiraceae bacterium]|nr:sugar O-acetyltransferase [Lachnospiraceae bacterium]
MHTEDIIAGFLSEEEETEEHKTYASQFSQDAIRITMQINSAYHTPEELITLMSELTGKEVDETFRLFPPFYTDFGKNITFGKHVFINSCCHFQDQGGIEIGDGSLIGHNVVLATINHDLRPAYQRKNHYKPVKIGKNVWIGSNSTVLPGITIGDWAVVGAGSVVTKDVGPYTIVAGNPARVIRRLSEEEIKEGISG